MHELVKREVSWRNGTAFEVGTEAHRGPARHRYELYRYCKTYTEHITVHNIRILILDLFYEQGEVSDI